MSSTTATTNSFGPLVRDFVSGVVVFLVALPLCLGIALASGAELVSGLLAGIVGGLVVAAVSGSHTSVSGPAAGLTAVVAAQIATLGSFEAFLLAVTLAGFIQIGFGIAKGGALSAFFPSSVIKGLLAAIGIILILKQIPHVLGHDTDPEGEMSFHQPDDQNTFSEILTTFSGDLHLGAMSIGILSVVFLLAWDRIRPLSRSLVPAPLFVVLFGTGLAKLFEGFGDGWSVSATHLVQIPIAKSASDLVGFLTLPDFAQLANPAVYVGATTIALVASLETLLNLEAADKLDPEKRVSPASRELIAQGCGNVVCGMIGGLPVTSVIVRSSVNVNSGAKTKLSAIVHGILLLISVVVFPRWMNMIPLSTLAAVLLTAGFKLANPRLFHQMWAEGRYQFIPFVATVAGIVLTDLLIGILIGLGVAILFILNSNLRQPVRKILEHHLDGDITHVELSNQVSFLNRAAIERLLNNASPGTRLRIVAAATDYIDPDVLCLIRDFKDNVAQARGVKVNLVGFKPKFEFGEVIQFADYTTQGLQQRISSDQVIEILRNGNRRFVSGNRLNRDLGRHVAATAAGQNPLAAVLACIDSRVPTELVFDLGVGDIFSVRVAGNVVGANSLGSLEYAVNVAKVKLLLVLGHTRCGAVTSAAQLIAKGQATESVTGCLHLQSIVEEIEPSVTEALNRFDGLSGMDTLSESEVDDFVDAIARNNVLHTLAQIVERSAVIRESIERQEVKLVGAMYDVKTGNIEFLEPSSPRTL
ncbi:MAG: bifunctional SulP family inorganic anion transporter/carbonic anhydrase [Planctomycetales bacterium]|nr:bifunctional SulP family inorganic anion transporter/carbonic anhydrase [Planctomycetales bacterium]MCA9218670.1 bifunctional SulP family inorganic anion transporter/carbonic anhydrase [Planctomycetales bacterium]